MVPKGQENNKICNFSELDTGLKPVEIILPVVLSAENTMDLMDSETSHENQAAMEPDEDFVDDLEMAEGEMSNNRCSFFRLIDRLLLCVDN